MRCEHDTSTLPLLGVPMLPAERQQMHLPAIEPPPAQPPKTTQAQRLAAMGYVAPKDRPCCANCKGFDPYWLNPDSLSAREMPRCKVGGFPVLRGGHCNQWQAAR